MRIRIPRVLAALVALGWAGSCWNEPYVNGDQDVTVGQKLAVEVAQGPGLASGQVRFTDSAGAVYGAGDLEYEFLDDHHVRLRVPVGAATGPAVLHLGAQGRPEGYDIDLTVHRMAVLLDPLGSLYCVDTDTGRLVDVQVIGHGRVTADLLDRGAKILATSSAESSVHFLRIGGSGLEPYSPAVQGVARGATGAVRFGRRTFVGTEEGVALLEEGAEGSTVLRKVIGRDLPGPVWEIRAAWDAGRAALLVGFSQDATDFQEMVTLLEVPEGSEPVLHLTGAELPGTVGGSTSLAISRDGAVAWVNNRVDDTVVVVRLGPPAEVVQVVELPAEEQARCEDPFRVVSDPFGRYLAVACAASKSLVLYDTATDGGLSNPRVVALGDVPWDAAFTADRLYVLLGWKVVALDPTASAPEAWDAGWEVGVGMSRIFVQP